MQLLSRIISVIQEKLFPVIQQEMNPLTDQEKKLINILEVIKIESVVLHSNSIVGRKRSDRYEIARSFVAKKVYKITETKALIERLGTDENLRKICGWNNKCEIPSESKFSRVFAEFSETDLSERAHGDMVKRYLGKNLIWHNSRDASEIDAREKAVKKEMNNAEKNTKPKRKRGRPKKGEIVPPKELSRLEKQFNEMTYEEMLADLPKDCNWGTKKSSKGRKVQWCGYKLNVDWADGDIPISCILTSASVYDNQVAIPLAIKSAGRVTNMYDLMDAGYDSEIITKHSKSLGHVPIIDDNPRRGQKQEKDPDRKERYKNRSTAERGFGNLKDNYCARTIMVKGYKKVFTDLMFGIIALCANQMIKLVL